jgi:hypothetical protein
LAIPSLAASLRNAGIRTSVRDLNLEGLLSLLEPSNIADAASACRLRLQQSPEGRERERLKDVLLDADYVTAHVGDAVSHLRDRELFYRPHVYHHARQCIIRALDLTSAAAGPVRYNIGPVRYDVDGVDATTFSDLARVTADPQLNLFDRFYHDDVLAALERDWPNLVGLSILNFQQVIPGLTLARLLKSRGHFVVIGGTVFTKFVDSLLRLPEFFALFCDGVMAYEGETALKALVDQLAGERDFADVPNFLHLDSAGRPTISCNHVERVNELPTPDFDGLPLDQYLAPEPVLPILTGKGCYFNRCKFCDIPFINHVSPKAYRLRAPERIANDIATLQGRYGVRHFEITDEALAPKLLLRLADALADYRDVNARFVGFARLEPGFTAEVCQRIHDMGVRKLFFGLESGCQETLDHMQKGIQVENAHAVLRNCLDAGIAFHVFSIVGFPEETEERARETLRFFLGDADVIGHPRNSFDIHPFSLDLRTNYSSDPTWFGIEFDRAELESHDFSIAVARWENTRGIGQATAARLLREFHRELFDTFRDYHPYPMHIWPDFGSYAVLYASHYESRPFPYRYSLPPAGDPRPVRLIWSDSMSVEWDTSAFTVRCLLGEARIGPRALSLLAKPPAPMLVDQLLETLVSRVAITPQDKSHVRGELRTGIDRLLRVGALHLEPEPHLAANGGCEATPDHDVIGTPHQASLAMSANA